MKQQQRQIEMASATYFATALFILFIITAANGADIFLDWHVVIREMTINPRSDNQQVITINGMFPGPLINVSTDDVVHINVFNDLDEPLLMTWNGIQQRLNAWQDGVSGTNCPILPGTSWTYVFQTKDQIGSFFYFPSTNFHKAGGGFGPIRVNPNDRIPVPFSTPDADFDLLIGDWYLRNYKDVRSITQQYGPNQMSPDMILINGKSPFSNVSTAQPFESFTVAKGKTYRFRIYNVGTEWSFNFLIQGHEMTVEEAEGSYTNKIRLKSLDKHVGQSYSVLVTMDQNAADYYIVATPKLIRDDSGAYTALGVLHYETSAAPSSGPLPDRPDPFDVATSMRQARSMRLNLTAGAARPNPQGSFNVWNVTLSQRFALFGSNAEFGNVAHFAVNNVSYIAPETPLKLADYKSNGSGVYRLDEYPVDTINAEAVKGVFVTSGDHKGWLEIVFENDFRTMDSWHLDGFSFFVVGFGEGRWQSRSTYNLHDPVYPGSWTAVYVYLDNPGMWNLRSQQLKNWYLGQELYVRVYDADPNPAKERPPPHNLLLCGIYEPPSPPPSPRPSPPSGASSLRRNNAWSSKALLTIFSCSVALSIMIGL